MYDRNRERGWIPSLDDLIEKFTGMKVAETQAKTAEATELLDCIRWWCTPLLWAYRKWGKK